MGGFRGHDRAPLEANYFAAAATHGMEVSEDYYWVRTRAGRRIPVAICIGDGEQRVLYDKARKTHGLLRKENLPLRRARRPRLQRLRAERPYQRRRL